MDKIAMTLCITTSVATLCAIYEKIKSVKFKNCIELLTHDLEEQIKKKIKIVKHNERCDTCFAYKVNKEK